MRNIFLFFLKFHAFFLFFTIELIAGYCLVQFNNHQRITFSNTSNSFVSGVYEYTNSLNEYLNLTKENKRLAEENATLRSLVKNSYYYNLSFDTLKNDSVRIHQFSYICAKVINNSTNKRNNYITINRGNKHGIKKNMGVINSDGVIGIVHDVSEHFSSIISLLHKDTRINAILELQKNNGEVVWDGADPSKAILKNIPAHVIIKEGDHVVTSGFSSIFPANISIGKIDKIELKQGDSFYNTVIKLTPDFSSLNYLYVINNSMQNEQKELEQKNINDSDNF